MEINQLLLLIFNFPNKERNCINSNEENVRCAISVTTTEVLLISQTFSAVYAFLQEAATLFLQISPMYSGASRSNNNFVYISLKKKLS